jgi:translation initiation factor RLI1
MVSDKSGAGNLWDRALADSPEKDRNTLMADETRSKLDIDELLDAVRVKREMCLRNQWEFKFRDRVINLRDQADKIISWLVKFKEVGDIAIQHDPSHAALPWAGIRFMLQVGGKNLFHI